MKKNGGRHSKNVWGKQAARTKRAPQTKGKGPGPGRRRSAMVCAWKYNQHFQGLLGGVSQPWATHNGVHATTRLHGNEARKLQESNDQLKTGAWHSFSTAFSPKFFGSPALRELGRCGQKHAILGGGFKHFWNFHPENWGRFTF